ncbi:protein of unknown function DUF89 [Chlorobaculum parvum NCIB 8327]|uniref:Damage-control phosphatase ARMT1-like metal-binding domain-containing protein n=1 Tax=Chlorobaculum parvum (strain DSM 263 / NCIMB 8327) TaxID=517417 RepID=B3QLT4_CHLP8|nr:ARMT1-like domain-containing protein [Chlorobaculum parvum]ACF12420.1 protein of unknown function DUF89 [Chlorobaculum parvum NCIB 8327]
MNSKNRSIPVECYPCLFEQLLSLTKITGMEDGQGKALFEHSMQQLLESNGEGIVVQHVIRSATDDAIALSGRDADFDPYCDIKQRSNDVALAFADEFRARILDSPKPLEEAVRVAAAGNIIDFGAKRHGSLDVEHEVRTIGERTFGRFDFEAFLSHLQSAKRLLYICDNAGEIVFDRLFIEEIRRHFPQLDVTCAVRERPVINDAVMADARYAGLDKVATVISSGSVYPGTLLEAVSDEFRRLFDEADLIVSKGQGNFETLLDDADERLFFILRIKCDQMSRLSGIAKGELVLMQGGTHRRG